MPAVLMTDKLRIKVEVKDKKGIFPDLSFTVRPFTETEQDAYFEKRSACTAGLKEGDPIPMEAVKKLREVRNDTLAAHIDSWDIELAPGTPAAINKGTVGSLPPHCYEPIIDAILCEAGKLLGN